MLAHIVQGADVRMLEGGHRARFTIETVAELPVGGNRCSQNFDGDSAVEARIGRALDFAHSAAAERALDFVRAEANAGG